MEEKTLLKSLERVRELEATSLPPLHPFDANSRGILTRYDLTFKSIRLVTVVKNRIIPHAETPSEQAWFLLRGEIKDWVINARPGLREMVRAHRIHPFHGSYITDGEGWLRVMAMPTTRPIERNPGFEDYKYRNYVITRDFYGFPLSVADQQEAKHFICQYLNQKE